MALLILTCVCLEALQSPWHVIRPMAWLSAISNKSFLGAMSCMDGGGGVIASH